MLEQESASLRYHLYQFLDKTNKFELLGPNLPKNGLWGQNFKTLSLDSKSASLIYCVPIFRHKGQLQIFGPKFAQKWILGSEFKKSKSGFGINTSIIPLCQFSVKMDNI